VSAYVQHQWGLPGPTQEGSGGRTPGYHMSIPAVSEYTTSSISWRGRLNRASFDASYVQRLAAGDTETERHFYTYFRPPLLLVARARLYYQWQVEDAVQETFRRVLQKLRHQGGVSSPEAFGAFVHATCKNCIFEIRRDKSAAHTPMEEAPDPADKEPGAEEDLITEERKQRIRLVLDSLADRDQVILRALFYEDRDRDEVSEAFGVTREHLRLLLHRALTRFRKAYLESQAASAAGRAASTGGGRVEPLNRW
jgi:RNA polymerase sigma-70 factor (ECF subfamily)